MNDNIIYLMIIAIVYLMYKISCYNTIEKFAENSQNISEQIKEQIEKIYKADVQAIRNLSDISKKLQVGSLTIPGNLTIEGDINMKGGKSIKSTGQLQLASNVNITGSISGNTITNINNKMSSNTNLINSTKNALNNEINGINSRFKARFPANNILDLGKGRIIADGENTWDKRHMHFTGPKGLGSIRVAFRPGSNLNWMGHGNPSSWQK